jgi:hypothetical protein
MTEEFALAHQASHRAAATRIAHRERAGERVIFVVEDDWRTRHFICTVLKYSVSAMVFLARELAYCIDLLISNIEVGRTPWSAAGPPASPSEVRRKLLNGAGFHRLWRPAWPRRQDGDPPAGPWRGGPPEVNPSTSMSGRRNVPPCDIPAAWRFLSIPFPTAAFLDCVRQLCGEVDRPK